VYGIRNNQFLNTIDYLFGHLHNKRTCDSAADDNKNGVLCISKEENAYQACINIMTIYLLIILKLTVFLNPK
jgi:hypothetical protein